MSSNKKKSGRTQEPEDFWGQAVSAKPESSWGALVLNLLGWSTLIGVLLAVLLSGGVWDVKAIGLIALSPLPLGHCLRSMALKARRPRRTPLATAGRAR
ncbi:hypothetical protein AB0O31_10310 [Kitasatospora cineracea]|uniref:hypothetical protein n=1 Tax=Kitasatospora cineracea TaxID=88074 RepID=UPI003412DA0B